jgi:hypothetical protein
MLNPLVYNFKKKEFNIKIIFKKNTHLVFLKNF